MYQKVSYDTVCECCGKTFVSHHKGKRFCSRKCKDVDYKRRKGQDSRIEPYKRQCVICGKQFETFISSKITCSNICSAERKRQRDHNRNRSYSKYSLEEYLTIKKNKAKANAEIKALEKMWYNAIHTVERECIICGSLFYCQDSNSQKTCSSECSKKYKYRKADKRIPKNQIVDCISLKRLYKRDNGICYLCGEKCDWESINVSAKGNTYNGDKYPTIEHVVPISKGGLHSWDNVRLACRKCNCEKADGIIKIQPMCHEKAYSEQYISGAKKTAQYTLDGELIAVFESTGQIKRELGFNSKRIQDVCRGEGKTAFGFVWKYVG